MPRFSGWVFVDVPAGGTSIHVLGYGAHLAAIIDPGIYERQASGPPGFADVIGGLQPAAPGERSHWHVSFSLDDRDAGIAIAEQLGATVLSTSESPGGAHRACDDRLGVGVVTAEEDDDTVWTGSLGGGGGESGGKGVERFDVAGAVQAGAD